MILGASRYSLALFDYVSMKPNSWFTGYPEANIIESVTKALTEIGAETSLGYKT